MPHEGYADPVTNDGPRFHLDMPISELTERITRTIRTSDVSSTPLVAETSDGATITKMNQPSTEPLLCMGAQGKLDLQGDRTPGHRTIAHILGRGYLRIQEMLSPTSFAILSSIFSDIRPQRRHRVGSHSGADKGINTPVFLNSHRTRPLPHVKPSGTVCGN